MTPCPDIERLVDDAAAGLPGAAERLDAHAATCAACLAEAEALDDGFDDALACLRDETCPPEVLAAVFAEVGTRTRPAPLRAADRPSRPAVRPVRSRVWTGVLAAAALVALATFWPRTDAPLVAETTPVEARESPPQTLDVIPPVKTPATTQTPDEMAVVTEAPSAPRRARSAPRHAPRHAAAPRPAPVAPVERLDPAAMPNLAAVPSPADSAAARQDLMLAFSIVARAQRSADAVVQTEMRRVSTALEPTRIL